MIQKFTSWLSKRGSATNSYIFFSCHHIQLLREESIKVIQVSSTFQSLFCCSISCCIKSLCAIFFFVFKWFCDSCICSIVWEKVLKVSSIYMQSLIWGDIGHKVAKNFSLLLNLLEVSTSTKTSFTLNMELIYFGDVISHVLVRLVTSSHQIKHGG